MTRAILLSAGYGTRLGQLSSSRPKPMLPVCDIPILRFNIALLVGHGISDIVINLHHHGQSVIDALGDGSAYGARIRYSHEPELLGTGGALRNALPLLDPDDTDEPILSMNGKLIVDVDLGDLLRAHQSEANIAGMMVVRRLENKAFSAIDVESLSTGQSRVRNIFGHGNYMFCGIHVIRPSAIRNLPEGESCSVRQGYLPWIQAGQQVAAYILGDQYFAEHSNVDRYLQSNFALLDGAKLRFPPAPLSGIDPTAQIDPTATITPPIRIAANTQIDAHAKIGPYAVIGYGAHVTAKTTIDHSVVWPNAQASGSNTNCVITETETVPATAAKPANESP